MNEKFCILIRISVKFAPEGQIYQKKKIALVHVMAWRLLGYIPELVLLNSLVHICGTRGDELITVSKGTVDIQLTS